MMYEKDSHDSNQASLNVDSRTVRIDGRAIGLSVSLGHSFLFYTTDRHLQQLDGRRFDSEQDLHDEVRVAVNEVCDPTLAA